MSSNLKKITGKVFDSSTKTTSYFKDGLLHRDDGPAVEDSSGSKFWYKCGNLHREDGPAIEFNNGEKQWYKDGLLHRDDGPAIEYSDGTKYWYFNGKKHREDGPAVEFNNGDTAWYFDGKLHREDGPAVDIKSEKRSEWWVHGKRHKIDGPAIETQYKTHYYIDDNFIAAKPYVEDGKLYKNVSFYNGIFKYEKTNEHYWELAIDKQNNVIYFNDKIIDINNFSLYSISGSNNIKLYRCRDCFIYLAFKYFKDDQESYYLYKDERYTLSSNLICNDITINNIL